LSGPLVSVVIPAYNAEGFIVEALDSVVAQTYRPVEIIVVNDGSTDRTESIVKEYQQTRQGVGKENNIVYICQGNSGPSSARNRGIKEAGGEYVAFLDADDLWMDYKLEKQINLFRKDAEIDIVFSDVKITRLRDSGIKEFAMFKENKFDREFFGHDYIVINPFLKLLKTNFMLTPTVTVKRTCFSEDLLFNENRRHVEDWELWLNMALYCKFGYVSDICVHVKDMKDGLSADKLKMRLSVIDVVETFFDEKKEQIEKLELENDFLSTFLKDEYKWTGYNLMKNRNSRRARAMFRKSLKEAFDLGTVFYYIKSYFHV
jgi:glycosyltransferase involved in cell wall biosynthesis